LISELHIVCLDSPWPADYGGAIDMMNRIIMMKRAGVGVHLHYFNYNERADKSELQKYCLSVQSYTRKKGRKGLSSRWPYIIASRTNDELAARLNQDNIPVLFEGIHCTGVLSLIKNPGRKIIVRMHNEESIYYKELARAEPSLLKKLFYLRESRLLKKYNDELPRDCTYACVTLSDAAIFKNNYRLPGTIYIPTFPSWQQVTGEEGIGNFCLFHGNLSVPENEEAATWLLRKVFTEIRVPLVIAGKKPSRRLRKLAHLCQHTCLVADPGEKEINDLVRKAHIHVLPCFNRQSTGIRLKLLHALFEGRHCIVNEAMIRGTGLDPACHMAETPKAFASIIAQLYHQPFTPDEILLRKKLLGNTFDNEENNRKFIQYLS
jgi:hypothetical protein